MDELIIGIDLGTTRCCVATWRKNHAEVIPNDLGERTTPSIVSFTPNQIVVGEAARKKMQRNLKNTIYDSKRLIGRKFKDPIVQNDKKYWSFKIEEDINTKKPQYIINRNNKTDKYFPEEISSLILQHIKLFSSKFIGKEVKKAIITVPAYFNNEQREMTKKSGEIAGLEVIRIINEPTAAAIAYGLQNISDKERKVLIFDLGGGTFDVSILKIHNKKFEVLSTCGDSHLGGEDFTIRLTNCIIEKIKEEIDITKSINFSKEKYFNRVREYCERAKKDLSFVQDCDIDIDAICDGEDFYYKITRSEYETICEDLFLKCIDSIDKAIKEANLKKEDIDDVVLAGGSSRTPKIQEIVKNHFGIVEPKSDNSGKNTDTNNKPDNSGKNTDTNNKSDNSGKNTDTNTKSDNSGKKMYVNINPDEAIANGAAIAAYVETSFQEMEYKNIENNNKENKDNKDNKIEKIEIIDITPFPIGIEVAGGKMEIIIPKGTKLPERGKTQSFAKHFMPQRDNALGFKVNIFEGDEEYTKDNHKLGEFTVTGIPVDKKENTIIKILIELDHNSIITVIAKTNDQFNDKLTINKSDMYSEEDMKKFKEHAEEFLRKDNERKKCVLVLNDIYNINNDLKKNINNNSTLRKEDIEDIQNKYAEINKWMRNNPEPSLLECNEKINELETFRSKYYKDKK